MDVQSTLKDWLAAHDDQLDRFEEPIPIDTVASETGIDPETISARLRSHSAVIHHIWRHTFKGRTTPSKPYCLRPNGPSTVGLDWEASVVGAAAAEFRRCGFQTKREVGSESDVARLLVNPDLEACTRGVNQRDLWALRRDGDRLDLWIIEAKGKEAAGFDHFCFAEALGQVFEVPGNLLTELLGAKHRPGHGICWKIAVQLFDGWKVQGLKPMVTVALLVPNWAPDVVWAAGKAQVTNRAFYERPLNAIRRFIEAGDGEAKTAVFKYQRVFGQVLEDLESNVGIRGLARAVEGLRFRILTTEARPSTREFVLGGL